MTSPQSVWVGVIDNRHGTNLYADTTEAGIYAQLAAYCREYWVKEMPEGAVDPTNMPDHDVITAYFDHQADVGDEWYRADRTELGQDDPEPVPT